MWNFILYNFCRVFWKVWEGLESLEGLESSNQNTTTVLKVCSKFKTLQRLIFHDGRKSLQNNITVFQKLSKILISSKLSLKNNFLQNSPQISRKEQRDNVSKALNHLSAGFSHLFHMLISTRQRKHDFLCCCVASRFLLRISKWWKFSR